MSECDVMTREILYRFDDVGETVILEEFVVQKTTPCGKWIEARGLDKFVLNICRKRYAYESKDDALVSFKARKNKQIAILAAQIERVTTCRDLVLGKTAQEVQDINPLPYFFNI